MDNLIELEMRKAELLYDLKKLEDKINQVKDSTKLKEIEYSNYIIEKSIENGDGEDLFGLSSFSVEAYSTDGSVELFFSDIPDYPDGGPGETLHYDVEPGFLSVSIPKGVMNQLCKAWLEYIERENG